MPTLEEIREDIEHLDGASRLLGRKEIKELPEILWEDEKVEDLVQGRYNNGNGILVATNKRLVFIDKGWLIKLVVEDFPYDKMSSIQYETGMMLGKITVFASGNKAVIEHIPSKQKARQFSEFVRARISGVAEHASAPTSRTAARQSTDDMLSQLERLAKLKERGVLTDEEFQTQKQQILAS